MQDDDIKCVALSGELVAIRKQLKELDATEVVQ